MIRPDVASRISLGNAAMLAVLGALRDIARDVRDRGTWESIERTFYRFEEAADLFSRPTLTLSQGQG